MGLGRVELPTRSLGNCCSIHLSYSPSRVVSPAQVEYVNTTGRLN